jgi:hypothetical protein
VAISNDKELAEAVKNASMLLQEIQDYCERENRSDARVRFPRGYLRTASSQRDRLPFVESSDLKSNLSYTLILSDVILWLLTRTDIAATARDMLIKLFIFLGGSLTESITKDYLKGICGKSFKVRTEYLNKNGIISSELKADLDWVWDTRNNMHLFMLDEREFSNSYDATSHVRCANAFRGLIDALSIKGRLN